MGGRNRARSNFFLTDLRRVGIGNANPVKKPKVFELDPGAETAGGPGAEAFGDPGEKAFRVSRSPAGYLFHKKEIINGR